MKVYKLTNSDFTTRDNTKWGENVSNHTSGNGYFPGDGWLHYYHHPIVAAIVYPIHVDFGRPILWEAKAEGKIIKEGVKGGCTKLTTIEQIPLPSVDLIQAITFSLALYIQISPNYNTDFDIWAKDWLSGKDRSPDTARYVHYNHRSYPGNFKFSILHFAACQDSYSNPQMNLADAIVDIILKFYNHTTSDIVIAEAIRFTFPEYKI